MSATKEITKNLGGDRLGSGSKNNITLHNYNRSTHNLSRAWRSSMTPGTLVPFFKEVALPGDTWTINLNTIVKTIPTLGPLYGSFKLQLDLFTAPIRLYNGLLHNNMTKIGMKMNSVKLPKMFLSTKTKNPSVYVYDRNTEQISNSSLLKYLGLSGIGDAEWGGAHNKLTETTLERKFNAVPVLAYWDIYKNYYANKQEEKGAYITAGFGEYLGKATKWIAGSNKEYNFSPNQIQKPTPNSGTLQGDTYQDVEAANLYHNIRIEENEQVILYVDGNFDIQNATLLFEDPSTNNTTAIDVKTVFPNYRVFNDHIVLGQPYPNYTWTYFQQYVIGISYTAQKTIQNQYLKIQDFPLSNIDEARINILRDTGLGNEFLINTLNIPYSDIVYNDSDGYLLQRYPLAGLGLKTYQSDLFENWLETEWIDGVNGINQITAIDVSSGSFTIDALNLANKVYNMLNRIAVSGGSYEDWQEAVYTTEANRRAETPVYKGGMSAEIVFNEVISTTPTEEKALGWMAGRGNDQAHQGGEIEIWVDEPAYIMGIVSITPRVDYSQGNDWDVTELDTMDDLHKPQLDGIGFEDLLQERQNYIGTYWDGLKWNKLATGKTPAWMNYMTSVNKTYGEFADENKIMYMTLNRRYEFPLNIYGVNYQNGISDLTTYIDPSKYNYTFAETELGAQNFWVQIGIEAIARRVMSAKIIPSL